MPAYSGIRLDKDDTPIQISRKNAMALEATAQQCNSKMIGETTEITRAANMGTCFSLP